mmetsp:Transcript_119928/g.217921  ORF Transcript_119928/g.217921 Transcript_119928/m.217921 type:complete len:123 (+) Transcript_119928:1-369(+)
MVEHAMNCTAIISQTTCCPTAIMLKLQVSLISAAMLRPSYGSCLARHLDVHRLTCFKIILRWLRSKRAHFEEARLPEVAGHPEIMMPLRAALLRPRHPLRLGCKPAHAILLQMPQSCSCPLW